jgi:hypothetical protein
LITGCTKASSPPVLAAPDGLSLLPYDGPTLSVGGELDKLASNVALGRNAAGIHWRSDSVQGLHLGEAVALSTLSAWAGCFNEGCEGLSVRRFDGGEARV